MSELSFIYQRRSVRKFKDTPIPEEHIRELVKAATYAPSGKNQQNWHFVVVTDPAKLEAIAQIIERCNAALAPLFREPDRIATFKASLGYQTFFRSAPALVLVYAGPYQTNAEILSQIGGVSPELIHRLSRPNPGLQNAAAAMENLLLAAASLGYGTCWMTGPTYADEEISKYVGFSKPDYFLAAMTPLGIPLDSQGTNPPRKPLDEVLTIIR